MSSPGRVRGPLARALASGPALCVALALTAVTLRLLAIPLERDEGDFAYGAQRLLDGAAPWAEVYGMRPPGVYAAYALAIAAFGPSAEAIRLGLLCATAATAALLFGLGAREASRALHGANPFPDAVEVASWLRARSEPGDRIAVLGSEPEIYFYARRRAATPFVYAYELVQAHPRRSTSRRR